MKRQRIGNMTIVTDFDGIDRKAILLSIPKDKVTDTNPMLVMDVSPKTWQVIDMTIENLRRRSAVCA